MAGFLAFLSTIRWQDLVDIILNSYILFRVYALFRGTRVFGILVGMAVFWLFNRLAVSVGLILTSWAMQGITAAAALIIIVVFRNEIRAVLQAKTLKAVLWGLPQKTEGKGSIQAVVDAVFELASKHVGALVVFPGNEDLEEVVQSGIPWDGTVSKEMMITIFWRDNPVHDGAAVVDGDRVTQVSAILPLSRRDDLPSYYGTRHRAAAGLAEASDALVVLVSEERGQVLFARGHQIQVATSKNALLHTIMEHMVPSERMGAYPQHEKLRMAAAGLLAVVFIGAVWFSFTRGFETMTSLEVPIEYMNRDSQMEISETSVDQVRVSLGGSGALVKSVRPGQVQVRLDLSRAVVGLNTLTITPEDVDLPPGVALKEVKPHTVEVTLDTPVRKEIPVQVDWMGKLPENLVLTEVALFPDKVTVVAGRLIMDTLSTIYTEKVYLDGIQTPGATTARIILQPASIKLAPGSRDTVAIKYTVAKRKSP
jgi:diadenylate cyclase